MTEGRRCGRASATLGVVLAVVAIVRCIAVAGHAPTRSPPADRQYVLGVSNTLVGNGWREEMICAVKAQAVASGVVSKVEVANRNGGPAEQNADIRNLISAGANAIIINPSSATALNAVIAQAAARGIKIVSVDQRSPRRRRTTSRTTRSRTAASAPSGCSRRSAARATSSRCAASPASRPTPTATRASSRR